MAEARIRRWWHIVAFTVLGAGLTGAAAITWIARSSMGTLEGTVVLPSLTAPVTIYFDAHARPYVQAETLADALEAQGFLHATERLWQMELFRRTGRGRLAEGLGASLLETDRELWRAGVPRLAERAHANADPQLREIVDRYVRGVNSGMASLKASPPEFLLAQIDPEPWTAADVFAVGAVMAFDSANNYRNELLRLALSQALPAELFNAFLPDEPQYEHFPYVIEPTALLPVLKRSDALEAFEQSGLPSFAFGSNGWAVAPGRSRSGAALFAFDSHDTLGLPNLFYEVHLFYGDKQIRGWSVAGIPGVINGFNGRIAWGFTNIGDTQDLFLEVRDPKNPLRFRSPEGWYEASVDEISIPVKGAATERLRVTVTRNGRLISEQPAIALRWMGQEADAHGLDSLLAMNQAEDWPSFKAAIDGVFAPSANITYADVDGHIAFRTVGRLPVRGKGVGLVPLPGDEADVQWQGFVAATDLPALLDPESGLVAAANARVTAPSDPVLVSADNAPVYRLQRIRDSLSARADHDLESMRTLQVDWYNGQAATVLPTLLDCLDETTLNPSEHKALQLLQNWRSDPQNHPDLAAPLIFERWYISLAEALFASRLGPELYTRLLKRNYMLAGTLDSLILKSSESPWWQGRRSAVVQSAFQQAVRSLQQDLGDAAEDWRWGSRHRVTFAHELSSAAPLLNLIFDRGPFMWGGGTSTVGRGNARYDRPDRIDMAATVRVVIELSDPVRALAVIPGGQSGHPLSAHYDDQLEAYLQGKLVPLDVPDDSSSTMMTLAPARPPDTQAR